jgi:hypothetical protein
MYVCPVGAGPDGLSIGAHLRVAGVPHESWQSFVPRGMLLKSEPFGCRTTGDQVLLGELADRL